MTPQQILDNEIEQELSEHITPIILYLVVSESRNKRRFKISSSILFEQFKQRILEKLAIESVETIVYDEEDLIIQDQEDLDYLVELAEKTQVVLRVNDPNDAKRDLQPLSPHKKVNDVNPRGTEFEAAEPHTIENGDSIVDEAKHEFERKEDADDADNDNIPTQVIENFDHRLDDQDSGANTGIRNDLSSHSAARLHASTDHNQEQADLSASAFYSVPERPRRQFDFEPAGRESHSRPPFLRSINAQNSSPISNISYTDNLMYKQALKFAPEIVFRGDGGKMNVYTFRRRVLYHTQIHELKQKDLYKSLMNGSLVQGDALEVLQLNVTDINPLFGQTNMEQNLAEPEYAEIVKRIWSTLIAHYGHKDRVVEYTERLKGFKQTGSMSTMQYLSKFKTYRNELELEISIRNEDKRVHVGLTDYQYAQILIANAKVEVLEYVLTSAVEKGANKDIEQISLAEACLIVEQYAQIERMKRNALVFTRSEVAKKKSVYPIQCVEEKQVNHIAANNSNNRYCFSAVKSKCRKRDCRFAHFPENVEPRILETYFARFRNKDCRKRSSCRSLSCPFRHDLARRKNLGVCKFDGNCTRQKCVFYHEKQKDKNGGSNLGAINQIEQQVETMQIEQDQPSQNENDDNNANHAIFAIRKVYEDSDQVQWVFDEKDADKEDIEYSVSSQQNFEKLERIIKAYYVYGTEYRLHGFIDSGADCSVAGNGFFEKFPEYIIPNKLKSILLVPAGAENKYRANERAVVPVEYRDFDLVTEKWVARKKFIEIWRFAELPNDMVLFGRDAMKELNLYVYDRAALKYALYTKLRDLGCNTLLETEETNALFDRLQYRGGLQTGVYAINEKRNTVQAVCETQRKTESGEIMQIEISNLSPKVLSDEHNEQEQHNEIIKLLRNNNRLVRDPAEILSKIQFGAEIPAERLNALKQELVAKNLLEVFTAYDWDLSIVDCKEFVIKIKDESQCEIMEPYSLSASDTAILNQEIAYWIQSKSMHELEQDEIMLHASPAFAVHRYLGHTDDGLRIVKTRGAVDFVRLNDNTHRYVNEFDQTIEELQAKLSQYKYFNKSDISKYFYCIPVAAESKKYGGIVWYDTNKRKRYGIMDCVMHGLTDAPIYGQELTARAFEGSDCSTVQDDIFGGAAELEQCLRNFVSMLEVAAKQKFRLSPKKTACGVITIDAVGYVVKSHGMYPMPRNCTKALCLDTSLISDQKCLRSWLGALNFLNGYIPKLAIMTKRLKGIIFDDDDAKAIQRLDTDPKVKATLRDSIRANFDDEAKGIVEEINQHVRSIPLLHHIDHTKHGGEIVLKCDTSLVGVGASLWQNRGNVLVLCKLFSKALTATESRYSATEREAVGFVKACERFRKILVRGHFWAIVDHKALLRLFGVDSCRTKNYKLVRMRWRLAEYQFTMVHINGNSLGIAIEDFLSRYSREAILASKVKQDGIAIKMDEIKVPEARIDFMVGFDVRLTELVGFHADDNLDPSLVNNGVYTLSAVQQAMQRSHGEKIPFNTDHHDEIEKDDSLAEGVFAPCDNSMATFKASCDALNMLKNARLKDPLVHNPHIVRYQDINNCGQHFSAEELSGALKLQNLAANMYAAEGCLLVDINIDAFNDQLGEVQNIALVETRSQKKRREDQEYQQRLEQMQYRPKRSYIFEKNECIFDGEDDPLRVIYDTQRVEFPNICQYIVEKQDKLLSEPNFNETDYIGAALNDEIQVNDFGLLTFKERILIPSKLRVPIMKYYHTTTTLQHRGEKVMVEEFMKRFHWIGMKNDIREYIGQCPCRAAKMARKMDTGFKDKGELAVYYVTGPNQVLFLDLYGALPDGNYVASLIDGFDGYLVSSALRPTYDYTALGVIKFIIFEWLWIYGIPRKIVSDNGSNLISKLNRLFAMIFGIKTTKIFAYSPWVNGKVEVTMKGINRAVYIDKMRREIVGLKAVRDGVSKATKSTEYALLAKTAALIHNNTVKESTGYAPRCLRFVAAPTVLMDIFLRLDVLPGLLKEKYIVDGVIDYKKFMALLSQHRKFIMQSARFRKLRKLNDAAKKNEARGLNSEVINVGDYVVYRSPYQSKKEPNIKYGWIVTAKRMIANKSQYDIRNIFSGETKTTNKGHVSRFHRPLADPESLLSNELSRIIDLEEK